MKNTVVKLNYVLLVALLISTVCYDVLKAFPLKCLTSTWFVLLGAVNLFYVVKTNAKQRTVAILMMIGICLAMGGDVAIYFNFIVGAAVFAMGHVFYLITYCTIERIRKSDCILMLIIFAAVASFVFLTSIFEFGDPVMEVVIAVYCVIISSMTAKAVMNAWRERSKANLFFACGSVMFLFSDIMLVLNLFANTSDITFILCHSIYFPGQWVLAHAMYHLAEE